MELVVALVLLMGDPDATHEVELEYFYRARHSIQQLAVMMELMDEREVRWVMMRPEDFHTDLSLLRQRYKELRDAPSVHDSERFPERSTVNDYLAFNRAYRDHLDKSRPAAAFDHRTQLYTDAIRETDQLYQIWDTVRDARCEFYYVTVRRQALKNLRERIGYDAYYRGSLPPWVPTWRFQELR